jgi:hypothetical protein
MGEPVSDLRSRVPAQGLMRRTMELHSSGVVVPSGDSLSWYAGALGEIAVAGLLSTLGPEWTVLHSVPVGRADTDIDHVVIGPAGVFTINTKNHSGKDVWIAGHGLMISGHGTNYIHAAISEAANAERRLSAAADLTVPIAAVIVLLDPGKRTIKALPEGGVRIVADSELLALMEGWPVFSTSQVARIVEAAIKPGTWHDNPRAEVDGPLIAIQFNAIMARAAQTALAASPSAWSGPLSSPRGSSPAPRKRLVTSTRSFGSRPSSGSRRRRSSKPGCGELLGRLVLIGFAFWFFFGVMLPGLIQAAQP